MILQVAVTNIETDNFRHNRSLYLRNSTGCGFSVLASKDRGPGRGQPVSSESVRGSAMAPAAGAAALAPTTAEAAAEAPTNVEAAAEAPTVAEAPVEAPAEGTAAAAGPAEEALEVCDVLRLSLVPRN
jgi:hypothetical protein